MPGTPKMSRPLDENLLIRWLKENFSEIKFISTPLPKEKHKRTTKLAEAIRGLDANKPLYQQKSEVANVWTNLVGKAIIYLKFNDSREEYHDDEGYGVEKLEEFFSEFRKFEPLLYGAQEERYRDHLCHMLGVFIVGEYLIREALGGFDKILMGNIPVVEPTVTADEKEAIWCVIALTHDLGIALEKIPEINPKAEAMLSKFGSLDMQRLAYPFLRTPLDDFVIEFVSADLREVEAEAGSNSKQFLTHVQSKYFLKFSEAYEKRNHGIIGCLVLMKNLVFFLETDFTRDTHKPLDLEDAKQFLIRRDILRAIAAHSNHDIYYLKIAEFSFILRICDELHERERPNLVEIFEGKNIKKSIVVEEFSETSVHFKVSFTLESPSQGEGVEQEQLRKAVKGYFESGCKRFERILRSAVGGKQRTLTLIFEVADNTKAPPETYILRHRNPADIDINVPPRL